MNRFDGSAFTTHHSNAGSHWVDQFKQEALSKVPEVTLIFWIIKIAATTLGQTGGDTVTMTLDWGYLAGSLLFLAALIALVAAQIRASKFHRFCIGRRSSHRPPSAPQWRILPIARWASATPGARPCSRCASF